MSENWSAQRKHSTWRRLWLALAKAESELGLDITKEQVDELAAHLDDIDFAAADAHERRLRHDVMAHIHAFGDVCPKARPIIHLGATSCFVTDNADIIQMRDGLGVIRRKLVKTISRLSERALETKDIPCLGYTHFQPAQLTTFGKRLTLYIQDFLMDLLRLDQDADALPLRGVKGTTGTQASFLSLFDGDHAKVKELERRVVDAMGFSKAVAVSGQTYTRKIDYHVLCVLSGIAQSAHKMAVDIRLMSSLKEAEEPFESTQVGSSAMAYKRNPMRCERVCSLARHVMSLPDSLAATHANQWLERTLDDSAIRRIVIPEAFLGVDAILSIVHNVADGLKVWPKVVAARVAAELPFMATENILMAAVKAGGDRQTLHEAIRAHSMEAGRRVKEDGAANDLMERLRGDPAFACLDGKWDDVCDPAQFVGRAPRQVEEFIESEVRPVLSIVVSDSACGGIDEVRV